jgi:outer membrane protein assembly factor BamB
MRSTVLIAALCFTLPGVAQWNMFRGPGGSGIGTGSNLPAEFGRERNVIWKSEVPAGTSSPVLTAKSIFLTASADSRLLTLSIDRATGKVNWQAELSAPRNEPKHKLNSPASSTPVTDGSNVYAFFGEFGLVSYTAEGKQRWQLPLGPFSNLHGMAASPILAGHKLIMVCDQDDRSYIMAIQKDSGEIVWKTERPEAVHGFATPSLYQPSGGATQIIVPGSYQLTAYGLRDGKKLWWVRGLTWQTKASAVVQEGTIYATGWAPGADAGERLEMPAFETVLKEGDKNGDGRLAPDEVPQKWKHGGGWNFIDLDRDGTLDERDWNFYRARRSAQNVTMAIRPGTATGDLTNSHVVWKLDRSVPEVPTPLLYDGLLYTVKDGGVFTAINAADGKVVKQARLRDAIDHYYSSPVASDGKIYVASENGKISVVKPGHEWESIFVTDMEEPCYATPAIAGNRIYLRTARALYCFGAK